MPRYRTISLSHFRITILLTYPLSLCLSRLKILHGGPKPNLDENLKDDRRSRWELQSRTGTSPLVRIVPIVPQGLKTTTKNRIRNSVASDYRRCSLRTTTVIVPIARVTEILQKNVAGISCTVTSSLEAYSVCGFELRECPRDNRAMRSR